MTLTHIAQAALLALGLWALLRPSPGTDEPPNDGDGGGGVPRHPHARDPKGSGPQPRRRGPHGGAGDRPPPPERIRSVTACGQALQRH